MSYKINFQPSVKQWKAWELLNDDTTTQIGYGGAARSGKSYLECYWILIMLLAHPGTRWGIGRKELKTLRRTILSTFFKVCTESRLIPKVDYNYNAQDHIITFSNGSEVYLIDMAYQPSDPLYTRFGGLELTGGAIDESNECDYMAIDIFSSRLGWWKNDEYGIKAKLLETFNPDKGHVYRRYYLPYSKENESEHRKFIKALPSDNPAPEVGEWIENLKKTGDEVTIQRLIYGNFEYDDDPAALCSHDKINDVFTNEGADRGEKYISTDLAMQGRDLFVVGVWDGLRCTIPIVRQKSDAKQIEDDIRNLASANQVPRSNIIADSDGLGNYLGAYLKGIKTFHNNAKAMDKQFANIKSECAFKLAELINAGKIYIYCQDSNIKDRIIRELGCLKRDNIDKDEQKKRIISKEKMKELLGYSPDFLDMLLMRCYYLIHKQGFWA